jgi:hypothetical protein
MKNKDKFPKAAKAAAAPTPEPVITEPVWAPTWKWHLTTLAIIYVCLTGAYFSVSYFLSHVPPPYKLREIPKELTPWLKK